MPSSQPRIRSGPSICTRSQSTLPVSTMTLIRAISPLYSLWINVLPSWALKGWKIAASWAF
ncbi:hypothetical protein D3C80_1665510 [compost metagenome]